MIIICINIIILILMLAVMYATYQNRLLVFKKTNEFVQLVDEARSVKDELEQLLDKVIDISGNIVDNLISEQQSADKVHNESLLSKQIGLLPALDNIAGSAIHDIKADDTVNYNTAPDPEPVLPPPTAQIKTTQSFDLQNFHSLVRNLYQRGLTTKEIAQKLDKGQDEVSLIINLLDMQYINT